MGLLKRSRNRGGAASSSPVAAIDDTVWAPSPGSYLTDGVTLFLVASAMSGSAEGGDLYLELEDCGTLEIVLCPVRGLAEWGLRAVTPPRAA